MTADAQNTNEAVWALAIKQGERKAWNQFFESMKTRLLYFTSGILMDKYKQEAGGIVTDAFGKLWQLRSNMGTMDDMRAYLFVICRNEAYDWNRYGGGKSRSLEILTDDVEPYLRETFHDPEALSEIHQAEIIHKLYEAVKSLSGRQKEVMELLLQGKTSVEIGVVLQMSPGSVRTLKVRAVQVLCRSLADKGLLTAAIFMLLSRFIND